MITKVGAGILILIIGIFLFLGKRETEVWHPSDADLRKIHSLTVDDFSEQLIEYPARLSLLDFRESNKSQNIFIPNMLKYQKAELDRLLPILPKHQHYIIISDNQDEDRFIASHLEHSGLQTSIVEGGASGWVRDIINPNIGSDYTDEQLSLYKKRLALSSYFQGKEGDQQKSEVAPQKRVFRRVPTTGGGKGGC